VIKVTRATKVLKALRDNKEQPENRVPRVTKDLPVTKGPKE
jgi:hypothetical protein